MKTCKTCYYSSCDDRGLYCWLTLKYGPSVCDSWEREPGIDDDESGAVEGYAGGVEAGNAADYPLQEQG